MVLKKDPPASSSSSKQPPTSNEDVEIVSYNKERAVIFLDQIPISNGNVIWDCVLKSNFY